ncbi:MAG: ATP-binding cassette domain-containing protein [Firmicutes bacterium]|nr:ATP-binding cassette domain-containing protein [Bacillota bacterium]
MRVRVENVRFHYRLGEPVLKGVTLDFEGEATAIIGQNGAGKSTLVRLINGLLKPVSGEVRVGDWNTGDFSVARLARRVGLVFQNPNDQVFKSVVRDEVMFGPKNLGMSGDTALASSREALADVGLEGAMDANPYDLSLAERKLVSIASVVAMNTDVVIFDEPTIAQDYAGVQRIGTLIEKLKARGKLIIAITHDMDFVAEIFPRAVVLRRGEVIIDGSTREVFSRPDLLRDSFVEPPHATQLGQALGLSETVLSVDEAVKGIKGHRSRLGGLAGSDTAHDQQFFQ